MNFLKEENTKNPNNTTDSCIPIINPQSNKQPILYSLDVIIAVAYSVNSIQAAKVRKWANGNIKKRYLVAGV